VRLAAAAFISKNWFYKEKEINVVIGGFCGEDLI